MKTARTFKSLLFASLVASTLAHAESNTFSTVINDVRSPDAVNVQRGSTRDFPIRLVDIAMPYVDCPAYQQDCREREIAMTTHIDMVSASLKARVNHSNVTVIMDGHTVNGKTVAVVKLSNGEDIGLALLKTGAALYCPYSGHASSLAETVGYRKAEAEAVTAKLGIWSNPQFVVRPYYCLGANQKLAQTQSSGRLMTVSTN